MRLENALKLTGKQVARLKAIAKVARRNAREAESSSRYYVRGGRRRDAASQLAYAGEQIAFAEGIETVLNEPTRIIKPVRS